MIKADMAAGANIMAMRQAILEQNAELRRLANAPIETPQDSAGVRPAGPAGAPDGGFAEMVNQSLARVSAMQAESSAQQAAYERGEQTDIAAVMLARQKAGIAFEATMQVRNKLLSAYSDIMNMPI